MKRLSHALISIVLAALLPVTAVLPAFADGERDPFIPQPMIGYFYPDYSRGYPGEPPCVYWDPLYGQTIAIYVNGVSVLHSLSETGELRLTQLRHPGSYIVKLIAFGVVDNAEGSFCYRCESSSDPDGGLNPGPTPGNPTSPKTGRGAELWALLPFVLPQPSCPTSEDAAAPAEKSM